MEPFKKVTTEVRKHNISLLWSISDRWFRILEFSLIMGILNYFKDQTSSIVIEIIYWISWTFMFWLILEVIEFIAQTFSKNKTLKIRWLIWAVSFSAFFMLFLTITSAANFITEGQFGIK